MSKKKAKQPKPKKVKQQQNIKTMEPIPNMSQIQSALNHEEYRKRYVKAVRSTIYALIVVAAIAVLVATLWLPVLEIYGTSMAPTFNPGEIVVSVKSKKFETGDVLAFYYENKLLVKRYIAGSGDWVNIDSEGTVYVNGIKIEEGYITDKSYEPCDIDFPYQVPENKYFVLGDSRTTSIDSRISSIGCIEEEKVVGKIVFRVWPFKKFGKI